MTAKIAIIPKFQSKTIVIIQIHEAYQAQIENINNAALRKLWNKKLNSEIDCDITIRVATTGLVRKNHLDTILYQVQTHVTNTCFRNLQSMDIRLT
jgi:hypothetical protein